MSLAPANFSERLVPRQCAECDEQFHPTASSPSQSPKLDAAAAAEVSTLRASAAFRHFTESGSQVATGPDKTVPAGASDVGTVTLSSASRFILRLIAAHDGRSEADVLARLIAAEGKAIGLSPLLAAGAEDAGEDLADLPDFGRRTQTRFSRAREAFGNSFRGMRR